MRTVAALRSTRAGGPRAGPSRCLPSLFAGSVVAGGAEAGGSEAGETVTVINCPRAVSGEEREAGAWETDDASWSRVPVMRAWRMDSGQLDEQGKSRGLRSAGCVEMF